jgi:hypothetical protein
MSAYFHPDQHLVFHQDKDGQMMSGGYKISNLMFKINTPLFVSMSGGRRNQSESGEETATIIPEKFSDLFKDLAVPAGLFMMPPLFKPRNYAFEAPDEPLVKHPKSVSATDTEDKSESDSDSESDSSDTNTDTDTDTRESGSRVAPVDIFDRLLALVEPAERIKHDNKTRRNRQSSQPIIRENTKNRKTRRVRK